MRKKIKTIYTILDQNSNCLIPIPECSACDRLTEAILEFYEASRQANREVQLWQDDQVYVLQMTFMDFNNPEEVKRLACALEGR